MFKFFENLVDPFAPFDETTPPKTLWPYLKSHFGPFRWVMFWMAFTGVLVKATAPLFPGAIVAAGVVAYLVSPVDVIPELVPGFGLLDDVILAAATVALVGSALDREELLELWPGSEDALDLVLAVAEWALDLVPDPFRGWLEG